jgi:hypothetical protein
MQKGAKHLRKSEKKGVPTQPLKSNPVPSITALTPIASVLEQRLFVALQGLFTGIVIVLYYAKPVPGRAVLVLGFAAAAMSVDEGMNRWKKGYWLLLLGLFAALELKAISRDRTEQNNNFSQTLSTITGGDSYAFISLVPQGLPGSTQNMIIPFLVQRGNSPLHGMKIQILLGSIDGIGYGHPINLPARDVAVGERTQLIEYPMPYSPHKSLDFMVYYDALNGHWSQKISVRAVEGRWLQATQVMRWSPNATQGETLYMDVSPEFPMKNGEPDWVGPGSD